MHALKPVRKSALPKQAANDPAFSPDTPPPAGAVDPSIRAWAESFDSWLATDEGREWLERWERDHAAFHCDNGFIA